MTALQRIVKEAKRMRKLHPNKYAKWTDYVKAASKAIKKPGKKVADVNVTYRSAKKDADYIVERRQNGTFKGMMRVAGTKAKPKPATHTDKGSHNVKIKVVSGAQTDAQKDAIYMILKNRARIAKFEQIYIMWKEDRKKALANKQNEYAKYCGQQAKFALEYIRELKLYNTKMKKLIK